MASLGQGQGPRREPGRQDGKLDGSQNGRPDGRQDGSQNGRQDSKKDGSQNARQDGRKDGSQNARQDGKQDGRTDGRTDSKQDGRQDCRQDSRQDGRQNGSAPSYSIGSRVASLASWDSLYHAAEIVDVRELNGETEYYVHYIEYNKRLDEWLPETRVEVWKSSTPTHPKPSDQEYSSPCSLAKYSSISPNQNKSEGSFPNERKLTRNLKRRYDEIHNVQKSLDELNPSEQSLEREHEERTKIKNIQKVQFGNFEIDSWYFSPYPNEYSSLKKIFVCERCFKYMKKQKTFLVHNCNCTYHFPPGTKIYETKAPCNDENKLEHSKALKNSKSVKNEIEGANDPHEIKIEKEGLRFQNHHGQTAVNEFQNQTLCIYEVDGEHSKLYCQNLSLFSKLFLDHKTRNYDTAPFLFYVLTLQNEKIVKHTENGKKGKEKIEDRKKIIGMHQHVLGYFSKEKFPCMDYNISCILIFPHHQRKGYGKLLIAFAYELSKKEKKIATPERPLSDLGQVGFRSYWTRVLLEALKTHKGNLTIKDLSLLTCIKSEDIINTLQSLSLIKFWKGQHIISATPKVIEEHLKATEGQVWMIDSEKILWKPPSKRTNNPKN